MVTTTVQERDSVFASGPWQNWELVIGAGPHAYFGENDWKVKRKSEMVALPVFDLFLTKWISPSFGVGIGAATGRFKGLYQANPAEWTSGIVEANYQTQIPYKDADPIYDYQQLSLQRSWYSNIFGILHIDLVNLLGGYKPWRRYNLDLYTGGGLMLGFDKRHVIPSAAFNVGLINKYRVSDRVHVFLNVRGALVSDDFDGEIYLHEPTEQHRDVNIKMDGYAGVTMGVSIDIGGQKHTWRTGKKTTEVFHRSVPDTVKIYEQAVDTVNRGVNQIDTVTVKEIPDVWFHIVFDVNKWDIHNREMVTLQSVAELIKSMPGVRFLVCGYADKQTATPERNQMLSENRSKAVYDALVEQFGVDPRQLVRDAKGGVDYMFYDEKELSRCVMITPIIEK